MALSFKVLKIAKPTAGTPPFDSVHTGVGFQPKAALFVSIYQNGDAFAQHVSYSQGFSDGTTNEARSIASEDAGTSSDSYWESRNDCCILFKSQTTGTVVSRAIVKTFDSNGLTLTWGANDAVAADIFCYLWGGSDITNVKVGATALNTTAGNQDFTAQGFQSDITFLMATGTATFPAAFGSADMSLGIGVSSTKQGSMAVAIEDARVDMDTWRYQRTDKCICRLTAATGALEFEGSYQGGIANGFRINLTTPPTGADMLFYMSIKGGQWDTGTFGLAAGIGNASVTSTTFTPIGELMMGYGTTTQTTIQTHARWSIGAADSTTSRGCIWIGDKDAALNTENAKRNLSTRMYTMATENATHGSSVSEVEIDFVSHNSNGFTYNKATNTGTLGTIELIWVAFGNAPAGAAIERALATETVALSETPTRLVAKTRTRTDTAITVSETRARLAAKNRPLATQTVALSESVVRIKGKIKSLATETITVGGGTIARLLVKIRTGTDTVIIAENRNRLAAKNRLLATQTVAIAENRARLKGINRIIPQTTTIGVGSITRLTAKIRAIPLQTVAIAEAHARLKSSLRPLATQTITIGAGTLARLKASLRTISQTVILSENINRLSAKLRVLAAQTVILADSVARQIIGGAVEITRALSQTVALSEIVGRRLAAQRILSQTVQIAESLVRVRGVLKSLLQTTLLSESLQRRKSALRTLSQTVVSSDSITRLNTITRTISQTILSAENVVGETVGNLVRSLVETITVSDSIARRTAKLVILDQFIVIAEQASRLSAKLRDIPAQTIMLSDSATNELNVIIKNVIKTISQVTSITDYAKIEVIKKSQRFRKITTSSIKKLISNHPAWLLGTRGQHNDYEEFD